MTYLPDYLVDLNQIPASLISNKEIIETEETEEDEENETIKEEVNEEKK